MPGSPAFSTFELTLPASGRGSRGGTSTTTSAVSTTLTTEVVEDSEAAVRRLRRGWGSKSGERSLFRANATRLAEVQCPHPKMLVFFVCSAAQPKLFAIGR